MASSLKDSANASLTAPVPGAMSKLELDTDLRDFTVTCDDKEWKVHSTVLAVRSPFFKTAITNNMAEKQEMKIEIKDFEAKAMQEVLNYMYHPCQRDTSSRWSES